MRPSSATTISNQRPVADVNGSDDLFKASFKRTARVAPADTLTPSERYEELFVAVQTQRIFADSKSFADCVPRNQSPVRILDIYRSDQAVSGFDLATFVHTHFYIPEISPSDYVSDPDRSLRAHIDQLWPVLTRKPRKHPAHSSLLPLPNAYVVPGGRFTELYYWDSYFTMLGLAASGRKSLLRDMARNFAYLIDAYGHVPNGNRTYYLSRSQPPVFALMVDLFESVGVSPALHFLPQLRREHGYWMDQGDALRPGEAHRHVVRMKSGELLNRYWDDRDSPRDEAFVEDIMTARDGCRPVHDVYRDLRAAAASGWDFSSRWLDAEGGLSTIRTTAILPIDLNCFLYHLETKIAELCGMTGDYSSRDNFLKKALDRKAAINRFMWNEKESAFFDYDWTLDRMRTNLTAACMTPLFVRLANRHQADRLGQTLSSRLLRYGGVSTTEVFSDQQWDRPNGWAPLQWIAIRGLSSYGNSTLADDIACRWLTTVGALYQQQSKLVEKYAISEVTHEVGGGGGGEYPLQDGFGWTNGVTRMLLTQYPAHAAMRCRAGSGLGMCQ
ncbi:alpha,alpha-trehalase TreF [Noviherbaspirillum sp.]|uniref:alpha,alpha-trehalase TreF n=1 Tax=Noviherbaspirillum sp. TaxID=1926288 RepID=UPI002FE0DBED